MHRAQLMAKLTHVITGPDGVFVSWPDTMPQMIGVEPDRMIGSTREWLRLVHPDDRAWFREKAVEAGIKQARIDFEYRLRGPGGEVVAHAPGDGAIRGVAEPDSQMHWFNTIQDISEQKQAEQEQHAARQLLHNVVENIPTAVQLKSVRDDFRIQLWNKASEEVFGVPRQDAIGRTVHDLWPAADAARMHAFDRHLVSTAIMQDFPDRPALSKTHGAIHVHMRKVALSDPGGTVTHILVIADDITAQLADQTRLRESEARFRSLTGLSSDWYWEQDETYRFVAFTGGDHKGGWGDD